MALKEIVASLLAIASLTLSLLTLWLTQFRHGRLKMTQPTLICLKREMPSGRRKIFLRTLLFTTASKGLAVENMYLRVHERMGTSLLDFWGHTEGGKLTLGSGLFVGPAGVACDHHFNPRPGSPNLLLNNGDFRIEVFAATVNRQRPWKLIEVTFSIDPGLSMEWTQGDDRALFLYWNPATRRYHPQIEPLKSDAPSYADSRDL